MFVTGFNLIGDVFIFYAQQDMLDVVEYLSVFSCSYSTGAGAGAHVELLGGINKADFLLVA